MSHFVIVVVGVFVVSGLSTLVRTIIRSVSKATAQTWGGALATQRGVLDHGV